MAEDFDPLLMLASTAGDGMGIFLEKPQLEDTDPFKLDDCFSTWEAQDHCYDRNEECDVVINSEHDYYTRVDQAELPEDIEEHSYALNLPIKEDSRPSSSNFTEIDLCLCCCKWDLCQFTTDTVEELYKHIVGSHLTEKDDRICLWRDCARNLKQFPYKYLLERHVAGHIKYCSFRCDECGKGFVTSERLRLHVNAIHNPEVRYMCPQCHELFKTTSDRANHMNRTHMKLRNPCPNCGKLYAGRSALRVHLRKCSKLTVTTPTDKTAIS